MWGTWAFSSDYSLNLHSQTGGVASWGWCLVCTCRSEAFSPGVEKRLYRFFKSKNFGAHNAFLRAKLVGQLETWLSKNAFSAPEAEFLY